MELVAFSGQVAKGLDKADSDFDLRRRIVDYLNVRVVLAVEDGQQVAYLHCQLGYDARIPKGIYPIPVDSISPLPESESSANSPAVESDNCRSIDMLNTGYRRS